MCVRHPFETLVFFGVMAFFQFEISQFNKDLHISIDEYNHFTALEHEIVKRGGVTYAQSHGGTAVDSSPHRRFLSEAEVTIEPKQGESEGKAEIEESSAGGHGPALDFSNMTV